MQIILLFVDLIMPLLMVYWVIRKGSLSIVYVPFFYFMFAMQEKSKIIPIYHLILALLLIYYVIYNLPFFKRNLLFTILILFFSFQLRILDDPKLLRLQIIGMYWSLTIIALAPEIFKNYSKDILFKELGFSAFLILSAFIVNSTLSTLFGYYPKAAYGFTSGISFGNISIPEYNIFPIAVFLTFRRGILEKDVKYLLVAIIGLFFIILTLRRMSIALSLLAVIIAMIELLNFKQIKQFALYGLILGVVVLVVLQTTDFSNQLMERIEKRNLEDRDLSEEGRFLELEFLYKDLFVYYEYDPWFGYGPMSSSGNYGKKVFGNRPLHTDIASFIHGLGFFGLFLYLSIVSMIFYEAWLRSESRNDRLLFLFAGIYFSLYFLVGIPKLPLSPVMLFLTLSILFGKKERKNVLRNQNNLITV